MTHRMLALALCGLTLAACGSGGAAAPRTTTTSAPSAAPSTTTPPHSSVEVTPPAGPTGTSFQLKAKFQPQEKVVVEIDLPNGKTFKGQSHTATADGVVSAVYRSTATDPVGTFQVKESGEHGDQSTGQFEVTGGASPTTTRTRGTATTAGQKASTTTIRGTTSTTKR